MTLDHFDVLGPSDTGAQFPNYNRAEVFERSKPAMKLLQRKSCRSLRAEPEADTTYCKKKTGCRSVSGIPFRLALKERSLLNRRDTSRRRCH